MTLSFLSPPPTCFLLVPQGWTKPNAFHVCITSYKLVLQDHQAFRRKNWRYLILDEAQNIKNFKSQRWQSLLNFNRWARDGTGGRAAQVGVLARLRTC